MIRGREQSTLYFSSRRLNNSVTATNVAYICCGYRAHTEAALPSSFSLCCRPYASYLLT